MFAEVLQELASKAEGYVGMVVMGMDGIPIERHVVGDEQNFDMLATEATTLLRSTRQASEDVGAGLLKELVFVTERLVVMCVAITSEYVLFGAVNSGTNFGKTRFLMKRAAMKLEKEFL